MSSSKFSDEFKQDAVAQIIERGTTPFLFPDYLTSRAYFDGPWHVLCHLKMSSFLARVFR